MCNYCNTVQLSTTTTTTVFYVDKRAMGYLRGNPLTDERIKQLGNFIN